MHKYREIPDWSVVADIPSIYVSNAPEFNRSSFQRACVYHFGDIRSWIDIALQVLKKLRWTPECSAADTLDVRRTLQSEECIAAIRFEKEGEWGGPLEKKI